MIIDTNNIIKVSPIHLSEKNNNAFRDKKHVTRNDGSGVNRLMKTSVLRRPNKNMGLIRKITQQQNRVIS